MTTQTTTSDTGHVHTIESIQKYCEDVVKSKTTKYDAIMKRISDTAEFLQQDHPEVFTEQRHLDAGTCERAYWHYGYLMALHDVQKQMEDAKCQKKQ